MKDGKHERKPEGRQAGKPDCRPAVRRDGRQARRRIVPEPARDRNRATPPCDRRRPAVMAAGWKSVRQARKHERKQDSRQGRFPSGGTEGRRACRPAIRTAGRQADDIPPDTHRRTRLPRQAGPIRVTPGRGEGGQAGPAGTTPRMPKAARHFHPSVPMDGRLAGWRASRQDGQQDGKKDGQQSGMKSGFHREKSPKHRLGKMSDIREFLHVIQ